MSRGTSGVRWLLGLAAALLAWVAWAQRSNPFSPGQWAAVLAGIVLAVGIALLQEPAALPPAGSVQPCPPKE
jgi:hypothetical protein